MSRKNNIRLMLGFSLFGLVFLVALSLINTWGNSKESLEADDGYTSLIADISTEEPLQHMTEDFYVKEGFNSNLPIVILTMDEALPEYKSFEGGIEIVNETMDPWTTGSIYIIDNLDEQNSLEGEPVYLSNMRIKKRGHSSFTYDKSQYLMKMVTEDGLENESSILGMGEGDSWILNGSMADKSMLRNYLSYRTAYEASGSAMAPDSKFCEVLIQTDEGYKYQGVYLLMETISRGASRVDIDEFKKKNVYTSYIVRRDRFTNFDVMLDTYGRLNELSEEWIGLKYPSVNKLTKEAKQFIEEDFSKIEQIIYAEEESEFKAYDRYIDIDSFVDYFLINEFFGNYDAGEHSTYMYKSTGGKLYIGPVWDFDQALNNYFQDEMSPETLAFQTKQFFQQLTNDSRFIDALKSRYCELRKGALSEENVFATMDETVAHLKSARVREWYRWAKDYEDNSFTNPHNYYLSDYEKGGVVVSRFNDNYNQELYNMRTYMHKHGEAIQRELTKLYDLAEFNTSLKNENELMLVIIMMMFLLPSVLIIKKGS